VHAGSVVQEDKEPVSAHAATSKRVGLRALILRIAATTLVYVGRAGRSGEIRGRRAPGQWPRDVEGGHKSGIGASLAARSWSAGERINGVVQPEARVPASESFPRSCIDLGFGPVCSLGLQKFGPLPLDRHRTNGSYYFPLQFSVVRQRISFRTAALDLHAPSAPDEPATATGSS
jgi:hypothetical protein